MDIQTRKIEFIQEFLQLQNEDLLARLEQLLHSGTTNRKTGFQPMSAAQLHERIDKSLEDAAQNRLTHTDDLTEEIKQWQ